MKNPESTAEAPSAPVTEPPLSRPALVSINETLSTKSASERLQWGLQTFKGKIVLSSSFGIQSAVMLHLSTRLQHDIPVVLIDTGYLFPETYQFIDQLTERLNLNLKIVRPLHSPAWQESRYGKLWEKGLEGLEQYNQMNKVEPMQRALLELQATAWIAGLRRQQSSTRQKMSVVNLQAGRVKIHPIIDWTNKQVHEYLKEHNLPYHPLWEQGFVSVGDMPTTRKWTEGMSEEETRFFGLKRECGLHEGVSSDFSI